MRTNVLTWTRSGVRWLYHDPGFPLLSLAPGSADPFVVILYSSTMLPVTFRHFRSFVARYAPCLCPCTTKWQLARLPVKLTSSTVYILFLSTTNYIPVRSWSPALISRFSSLPAGFRLRRGSRRTLRVYQSVYDLSGYSPREPIRKRRFGCVSQQHSRDYPNPDKLSQHGRAMLVLWQMLTLYQN